jgi:sugar lactone lactonase YvrE
MLKRLALPLAAAALAACQLQPAPSQTTVPSVRQAGSDFTVRVNLTGEATQSVYKLQFATSEVTKLAVGIFDRATDATTVPSLGYFGDNAPTSSSTNPLTSTEFTNLRSALGTTLSTGTADKTDLRRYLFRTINSPSASPAAVTLTNFPNVTTVSPVHAFNLFVCAFDSYGAVIGYVEQDLTGAIQTAGTVNMTCNLNYGGLGTIDASSTLVTSELDPVGNLQYLLVGTYDTSVAPHLGWINDGSSNVAFTGTQYGASNWYQTLKDAMVDSGRTSSEADNTRRYLIRVYGTGAGGSVSAGARTTSSANVPVGTGYRSFILAIRDSDVDANHFLTTSNSTVLAATTTNVALGNLTTGMVRTFAGSGVPGNAEGTGTAATFNSPEGVFVDSAFAVFVADSGNHRIRKITPAGVTSLIAGSTAGFSNANGALAQFNEPRGVVVSSTGNVIVADALNHCIRKIDTSNNVTTLAGTCLSAGNLAGQDVSARFNTPSALAIDTAGNIYVADTGNHNIKKIDTTNMVTIVAGSTAPVPLSGYVEDIDGVGNDARFLSPRGIAVKSDGSEIYVADSGNHCIRKIVTATSITSLLAGTPGVPGSGDNPTGSLATFNQPRGLAVDSSGNIYIAATTNNKVRMVKPSTAVVTLAGSGAPGSVDDNALAAQFNLPTGISRDSKGRLFIADRNSHKIRKAQ